MHNSCSLKIDTLRIQLNCAHMENCGTVADNQCSVITNRLLTVPSEGQNRPFYCSHGDMHYVHSATFNYYLCYNM